MYNKKDAVMTRGFAILCMVVLHLFCRTGADVFGTPLIWIDQETPLVYWFGFYAEICVSVYSICMGYAQYLLYKKGKTSLFSTWRRILKIMVNYWIILVMFCIIGLAFSSQQSIPGSLIDFLKSIVLLHSYNGAWWFLNTYVLFLLIPPAVKFFPVEKLSIQKGLFFCLVLQIAWYLFNKMGFWPVIPEENRIIVFVFKELHNLIEVFPSVLAGAILCKGDVVTRLYSLLLDKFKNGFVRKIVLGSVWFMLFICMNLIHKAALTMIFAVLSFLLFNIWEKGEATKKIWLFLGKHSTNIWLTHMFFYSALFGGLVQKARYPLAILGALLVLCVAVSNIEMLIEKLFGVRAVHD